MTIRDRTRGNRLRIDAAQLADELARRLRDLDKTRDQASGAVRDVADQASGAVRDVADQASGAVRDVADQARHQLDRASGMARTIRDDTAHRAAIARADTPIDEIGQRIRAVATTPAVRALIARLESQLPDGARDAAGRAGVRGRTQARAGYLAVGLIAGVAVGAVAALLLDPSHGKERREAIARKTRSFSTRVRGTVGDRATSASDQARGLAAERGMDELPPDAPAASPEPAERPLVPVFAEGPVTDPASTAWEPLPADAAGEPDPAGGAVTPMPALDASGDHGTLPSSHG